MRQARVGRRWTARLVAVAVAVAVFAGDDGGELGADGELVPAAWAQAAGGDKAGGKSARKSKRARRGKNAGKKADESAGKAAEAGKTAETDQAAENDKVAADAGPKLDPRQARKLIRDAESAMELGKYKVTAKLLEQAYQFDPQAILLYNIGVAYQRSYNKDLDAEDGQLALAAYERFLVETKDQHSYEAIDAGIARDELKGAVDTISGTEEKLNEAQASLRAATETRNRG